MWKTLQHQLASIWGAGVSEPPLGESSLDKVVLSNLELLLARIGRVMMGAFLLCLPVVLYRRWIHGDYFTFWSTLATTFLCAFFLFNTRFRPEMRIRLISLTIFATGLCEMVGHGLIEDGRLLLFLACSIATATLNTRFSSTLFFASFVSVVFIGLLYSTETIQPLIVVDHPQLSLLDVASYSLSFFVYLGTVQFMMFTLFRFLGRAWATQLAIEQDLREQKESIERQVSERTKELQKSLADRQEILQIVAHELRNPIAGIKLSLETIHKFSDRITVEKRNHKLTTAIERLNLMNDTVNDLLQEDTTTAGEFWLTAVPILPLVSRVVRHHQDQAQAKGIGITIEMEHDHLTTQAEAKWLEQIITNLLSNAIKYSFHQGQIVLHISNDDKSIYIAVKDEGQGLSKDDLSKIFNKFTTLSAKPTGNESAVGLGLNIARELVTKMGGSLSVDSAGKGQGATFIVQLNLGQRAPHPLF